MAQISDIDNDFEENLEDFKDFIQTLRDLENKLRKPAAKFDDEGYSIEEVGKRLYELSQLKRKLRRTIPEILNLKQEVESNLAFLDNAELELKQADKKEYEAIKLLQKALLSLNEGRTKASTTFCNLLKNELKGLGFAEDLEILPNKQEKDIWHEFQDLSKSVEDTYTLLFAPNPGQPAQALDKIASGGELSRFLLAITSLQVHSELSLLIFDEVDAGIGGNTLNKVADRLNALSQKQQMLLITHWANLAKYAKKHFLVKKEVQDKQTFTKCHALNKEEIEIELNRMQGLEK